ncbi:unnamed protein product [Durusdinium trenchii]|uniref:Uncharacterized protein n=1 Tax=Durusdinium trenchii TaxID=1381693 RepID=A0ABP0P3F4_9DINO
MGSWTSGPSIPEEPQDPPPDPPPPGPPPPPKASKPGWFSSLFSSKPKAPSPPPGPPAPEAPNPPDANLAKAGPQVPPPAATLPAPALPPPTTNLPPPSATLPAPNLLPPPSLPAPTALPPPTSTFPNAPAPAASAPAPATAPTAAVAPAPPAPPAGPPLSSLPPPARRPPPNARRPAQMKPQDLEEALHSWLSFWEDCRSLGPTPAASGAHGHEAARLFVLRISSVGETEVPFSANGTLQKPALARLAKAAEEEAPEAVSIHVRLSFVHTPLGGKPEIYGHSFLGPRLQMQRVQSRISGSEGHLVAMASADPPALFFFRSAIASKELRLLAEVLAFEERWTEVLGRPDLEARFAQGQGCAEAEAQTETQGAAGVRWRGRAAGGSKGFAAQRTTTGRPRSILLGPDGRTLPAAPLRQCRDECGADAQRGVRTGLGQVQLRSGHGEPERLAAARWRAQVRLCRTLQEHSCSGSRAESLAPSAEGGSESRAAALHGGRSAGDPHRRCGEAAFALRLSCCDRSAADGGFRGSRGVLRVASRLPRGGDAQSARMSKCRRVGFANALGCLRASDRRRSEPQRGGSRHLRPRFAGDPARAAMDGELPQVRPLGRDRGAGRAGEPGPRTGSSERRRSTTEAERLGPGPAVRPCGADVVRPGEASEMDDGFGAKVDKRGTDASTTETPPTPVRIAVGRMGTSRSTGSESLSSPKHDFGIPGFDGPPRSFDRVLTPMSVGSSSALSLSLSPRRAETGGSAISHDGSTCRSVGRIPTICSTGTELSVPLEAELLHGVRLDLLLSRFGAHLKPPDEGMFNVEKDCYSLSRPVKRLETFISHDWKTSRWLKLLALLMIFNSAAASCATAIVSILLGILFSFSGLHDTPFPRIEVLLRSSLGVISFWVVICIWQRIRAGLFRPKMVFLDKLCIAQHDEEMKRKGIFGLASFLDHSDSLTILWSRRVFTRLWCAFEIATFLRHDREKPIEMMPVRLSMLYFLLVIVTQGIQLSNVILVRGEMSAPVLVVVEILFVLLYWIMIYAGVGLAEDLGQLIEQLESFNIEKAECSCCSLKHLDPSTGRVIPCDRELVLQQLREWFGSTLAFDSLVKDRLRHRVQDTKRSLLTSKYPFHVAVASTCPMLIERLPAMASHDSLDAALRALAPWAKLAVLALASAWSVMAACYLGMGRLRCLGRPLAAAVLVVPAVGALAILWISMSFLDSQTGEKCSLVLASVMLLFGFSSLTLRALLPLRGREARPRTSASRARTAAAAAPRGPRPPLVESPCQSEDGRLEVDSEGHSELEV